MAFNDVWRGTLHGRQQGQVYDLSFWFRQDFDVLDIGSDHDSLLDNLETIADNWVAAHADIYTLDELRVQKIWDAGDGAIDPGPIFSRTMNDAGTRDFFTFEPLAPWLCGYSSIHTSRGGRRGKGWFFWSNLNEADVSGTVIQPGDGSALEMQVAFKDEVVNVFVGDDRAADGWQLGVLSRRYAHLNPGAGLGDVWANATGIVVHTVLTSQKSRRG